MPASSNILSPLLPHIIPSSVSGIKLISLGFGGVSVDDGRERDFQPVVLDKHSVHTHTPTSHACMHGQIAKTEWIANPVRMAKDEKKEQSE